MSAELKPESSLESFCRACLIHHEENSELIQYTEKTRRQFVYATGLQVKRNDTFTFQLCKECYVNIKMTCKFKKQCRTSDKRYKNYLALKEAGETADFRSFLKKTDDTFRFPFMNGYSTPMQQKNKDDDNESATTSIQNFMTDILKAEEIPDTEVNIIRETIEEEADILDDSLDSQWLQDDVSIDTDFQLDFSFSPFATPRSTRANDRCNSTKKDNTQHVYAPISPFATPRSIANDHCYSTRKDDNQHVYAPLSFSPFSTPRPAAKEDSDTLNTQQKQHVYVTSNKLVQIQGKDQGKSDTLIPDSIDKNLEKALRKDAKEFSLDDLLVSPAPGTPLVSTPTINDILFGKNLNCVADSQSSVPPKIGQCIDPFNDVRGDDNIELFNGATINFYGSAKVAENDEMDISKSFNIDIEVEEVEVNETIQPNVDASKQEVPVPFKEEIKVEGEPIPAPEVFRPTVDQNLPFSKDKFQPTVEIVYEKDENKNKENEITTENSSNVEDQPPRSKFYCDICKFDTENYKNTVLHYRAVHKVALKSKLKEITHICEVCGKSFRHYANYYHHMKKHENPDRGTFICDICNRKFTARSKILLHMRAHMTKQIGTKKKPLVRSKKEYICNLCGARSSDSSNLNVHIRRHNKNYTVFCKECNKGFVRNQDFVIHMRKHTSEKPFACAECDKKFNRRDTLTTHMRAKHTAEKPFECEFCHAKFARGHQLTIHVRTSQTCKKIREDKVKDVSKAFECEFCHATFKYPCYLSSHVLTSKNCMRVRCGIPERPKRQYKRKKKATKTEMTVEK